jgi:hypothetical protein
MVSFTKTNPNTRKERKNTGDLNINIGTKAKQYAGLKA